MTHTLCPRAAPADFNKRIIFFTLIFRESPLHTEDPPGFQPGAPRELTGGGGGFETIGALERGGVQGWRMLFMLLVVQCTVVFKGTQA